MRRVGGNRAFVRWLMLGALFSWPALASAQELGDTAVGAHVSSLVTVHGKPIPLQTGDFEVVTNYKRALQRWSSDSREAKINKEEEQIPVVEARLMYAPKGRFNATVRITSNLKTAEGWRITPNVCDPDITFFLYVDSANRANHVDCRNVTFTTFELTSTPSADLETFLSRSAAAGRPNSLVGMSFYRAEEQEMIAVSYFFHPARWRIKDDPAPADSNSWNLEPASRDAAKSRVYNLLAAQSEGVAAALSGALRRQQVPVAWQLE